MSLVDWSKIPTEYKWATKDTFGVFVWEDEPSMDPDSELWYGSGYFAFVGWGDDDSSLIEKRPTEGDPT